MIDTETVRALRDEANDYLRAERRLERLHAAQVRRMLDGGMTRARTTSYNANAASAAEQLNASRDTLRELCNGIIT